MPKMHTVAHFELDIPGATPEVMTKFMMSSGDTAFRMVTASGPTGTAYVCHNCVRELMENIAEELGSKIL